MLKFPNARLLIHNLIAERKLSGEDAIAAGACELGLMSPTEIETVRGQSAAQESCACSHTAKMILKKHFENHNKDESDAFEKSWQNLQERSSRRLSEASDTQPSTEKSATLCAQHAPIIFDYLLQEVHSHT